MFHVLGNTILPIFSIILLGYLLKARRIVQPAFAGPANQIVYYVAIPAMMISTIARASFRDNFHTVAVLCLLSALGATVLISLLMAYLLGVEPHRRGTFLQSSFHGNIGYMSFAITYFALGESHFARTAILSSFLLVGQNVMAVWALTSSNAEAAVRGRSRELLKHILQNPIILSVVTGILLSVSGIGLPSPVQKGLDILSGMAFPTALLLIGASLRFGAFRSMAREVAGIGVLKLLCLPILGYVLMKLTHVPHALVLPGLILLATPPATVTYVMATELGGDPELAATSVSILTLLSAFTYSVFLSMF